MIQNKFILTSIAVSLLVVSCTEKADWYRESGVEIGFAASAGYSVTRGLPVESASGIPDMGVFAYYTGNGAANNWAARGATSSPDFMNNVQVTNNGGVWSYANPVYWPQAADANVSFFAYSPYANASNGITVNGGSGIPSISYTVPTNCSNQPDLMVSALRADLNKSQGSSPVNFQMRHALTCIGFKASGAGEQINKIKVTGVKTTGTLTVAADGTPTWDTSGAASGDFEATVNSGIYLDPSSQLVNTGGGYLMMIPQTLPTGTKLTIGVDDGRPDVEFDLGGLVWGAGQRINYSLTITPGAVLLLTPDKLVLPPNGGFSQFNVIEENGSSASWTLTPNSSFLYICDNLTHLQQWAAGTLPASSVTNLNGSTPTAGGTYTGTGTKTLYVWIVSPNPSSGESRIGTISQVGNPAALINVDQLPNINPAAVSSTMINNSYVGAFWTAARTGERIIRIPVTSSTDSGAWDASVLWTDGSWKAGDIVFSTQQSTDAGITYVHATQSPADMLNSTNNNIYKVAGYVSSASGNVMAGTGNYIYFRIGLTSTYTSTAILPARYAVVLLRYGTPRKNQLIFLRQGEEADYVGRGTGAPKWAVYNVANIPGGFMSYPSQAGGFKRWSTSTRMYAPDGTVTWDTEVTSSIANVCPSGYQIPNSNGTTTYSASNQLYSLVETGKVKSVAGYYSDGYFDRRAILASSNGTVASTVMPYNNNVAYTGCLLYNTTTYASVFLCKAGYRSSGNLVSSGNLANYWSSSLTTSSSQPYLLLLSLSPMVASVDDRNLAYSIRCVKP